MDERSAPCKALVLAGGGARGSYQVGVWRALMELDEPTGRKLDFIVQEMNREANTISSKIGDLEVTARVIEIKTCIEKIREQIQNVE